MAKRTTKSQTTRSAAAASRRAAAKPPVKGEREERWTGALEIMIAVALGIGAILTALSVYLIDQHDDEAQLKFNTGVRSITEATGGYVEGAQQQGADEALFFEYVDAAQDRVGVARYLLDTIMRPELKAMVRYWANSPLQTPFTEENPRYETPEIDEAEALTAQANEDFATAREEQDIGDRYILAGVIIATSLFLFGIAGVTNTFKIRIVTMAIGTVVLLVATGIFIAG